MPFFFTQARFVQKNHRKPNSAAHSQDNGEQEEELDVQVPRQRVDVNYIRSQGPGGQNVNKVNTKAVLRFDLTAADWMTDKVKERLTEQRPQNIGSSNKGNFFTLSCQEHRTQ